MLDWSLSDKRIPALKAISPRGNLLKTNFVFKKHRHGASTSGKVKTAAASDEMVSGTSGRHEQSVSSQLSVFSGNKSVVSLFELIHIRQNYAFQKQVQFNLKTYN